MTKRLAPRHWSCVALFASWLVFFGPVIFTSRVPYDRDLHLTDIPMHQYMAERLVSGHLPQWYPYEILGVPFAGTFVASPFHPQSLLHLVLSASVATKWRILLAYLFGLAGAYRLARVFGASRIGSIGGAWVFAFSGYAVSLHNNPMFLAPLMTAPWMLASVWRLTKRDDWRDVAALGLWWSLVLLGGDAQLWAECGVVGAGLLLAAGWRWPVAGRFAVGTAISAALTCAELLPALALRDQSERATWAADKELASTWSLHPLRLLDFLLPGFTPYAHQISFGNLIGGRPGFFAFDLFVGIAVLVVAIFGALRAFPSRTTWIITGLAGLLLATGGHGGLLPIVWKLVPPFAKFRYPEKYVGLTMLALVPLVALGIDAAEVVARRASRWVLGFGAGLIIIGVIATPTALVVWWLGVTGIPRRSVEESVFDALTTAWPHGLFAAAVVLLLLGGVLAALARDRRWLYALPALLFLNLLHANAGLVPLVSREILDDPGSISRAVQAMQPPGEPPIRVMSAHPDLRIFMKPPDRLMRLIHLFMYSNDGGRGHVAPFDVNSSAEEWRVARTFFSPDSPLFPVTLPRFNVGLRVASEVMPPRPGEEQEIPDTKDRGYYLVRRAARPRAYLTSAQPVPDFDAAMSRLKGDLPTDIAVWEGGPEISGGDGTVRWTATEPEHLELQVNATSTSALVVADAFAVGWRATVDGRPTEIYPTNGAGRGVVVPSGHHVVTMDYRAPGFVAGLWISFVGLCAALGLIVVGSRRRRIVSAS